MGGGEGKEVMGDGELIERERRREGIYKRENERKKQTGVDVRGEREREREKGGGKEA